MLGIKMSDDAAKPLISIIVPCYNSEQTIRRCLAALISQDAPAPFELIVVDSSTDRTPEIVEREFLPARLIHLDKRTYAGAARNIGIRSSRGRYCLMIDSDCIAAPGLLGKVLARHSEGEYAAVGGSLANGTPGSLSGTVGYLIEFKEFMPAAPLRFEKSIPTANIAYRREVFDRHGFFDDDLWLGEDILFNWKVYSVGERILFDPAMAVTHLNRTGWREVLSYQTSLGRLSAEARRRGGLPGSFLLRSPVLVLVAPFGRTFRAARWLLACDRKTFALFMFIWPLYLLAASFWSFGFMQGAMQYESAPGETSSTPSAGL